MSEYLVRPDDIKTNPYEEIECEKDENDLFILELDRISRLNLPYYIKDSNHRFEKSVSSDGNSYYYNMRISVGNDSELANKMLSDLMGIARSSSGYTARINCDPEILVVGAYFSDIKESLEEYIAEFNAKISRKAGFVLKI